MKSVFVALSVALFMSVSAQVRADDTSVPPAVPDTTNPASVDALSKTQNFLKDANARKALQAKDPRAKQADDVVQNLTGGSAEMSDDIYGLAADILQNVMLQGGGDGAKMNEIMVDAMKDPSKFAKQLTPAQQARLKAISDKIEGHKPASQP